MKKLARRGLSLVLSLLMVVSLAYTDISFISKAEETNHVWTKVSLSDITSSDSIAITMSTSDGETYVLPNASTGKAPVAVLGTVNNGSLTIEEGSDADYAWTITKNTVEETVVAGSENNTEAETATVKEKTVTEEAGTIASEEKVSEEKSSNETASEEKTEEVSETTEEKTVVENAEASEEKAAEEVAEELEKEDDKDSQDKESEEKITRTYYTIGNGSNYLYTNAANNGVRAGSMPKDQVGAQWQLDDTGYLSAKDSKDATRFLGVYNKQDWRAYTLGKTGDFPNNIKGEILGFYKLTSKVAGESKVSAPKASVESGTEVEFGAEVELTCDTEDAKIYYNVNGSEDNYSPYKKAIEITKETTIYAYSVVDETKSEIVSFNYKLIAGSKITDATKLEEGQEFVLAFNDEKVLSTEVSGKKLAGVDVKLDDNIFEVLFLDI